MPYSYIQLSGNGSNRNFGFSFGYLSKSHVDVKVNGVSVPFTWLTDFTVQVASAPASGALVEVRRTTPLDRPIVDWADGSTLTEADMNLNTRFSLYTAQEAKDRDVGPGGGGTLPDASVTTAKLADASVTTAKLADASVTTAKLADASVTDAKLSTSDSVLDAITNRLKFLAAGAGAIFRPLREKLRDQLSVKDFGAVGNGAADDTAAFKAAVAAAISTGIKNIHVPAGSFKLTGVIAWEGAVVNWIGAGSGVTFLLFHSGAAGFRGGFVTPIPKVSVRGFSFVQHVPSPNGATGAAMWFIQDGSTAMSLELKDIIAYGPSVGSGNAADGYWGGGLLYCENPSYTMVRDCYFFGIGGIASLSKNTLIDAAFTTLSRNGKVAPFNQFENCFANNCRYGFYFRTTAQPGIEGVFISHCNTVATTTGVRAECTVPGYYPPEYHVHDSQFECITFGISVARLAECYFHDNLIFDEAATRAMDLGVLAEDVRGLQVSGGRFEARPGNTIMGAVGAITGTTRFRVHHIDVNTPAPAVRVYDAASYGEAYDGIRQDGAGGAYLDVSSNASTNRGGKAIANPGYQWNGEILEQFGSVVVNLDGSGNFTYNFPRTFPNAVFSIHLTNGNGAAGNQQPAVTSRNTTGFVGNFPGAANAARQLEFYARGR